MVFIVLLSFLLILRKIKVPQNKGVVLCVILIFSMVYSNRSMLVPDTLPYVDIYNGFKAGSYEQGYILLCDFFRNKGFSFSSFLFVLSFVSLSIWFCVTQEIINKKYLLLSFVLYTSYMGIYYHGIVLRACLAILINYIGIYYGLIRRKNYIFFYICVFASIFFHISSILFAPLPLFIQKKYNTKTLYIIMIASFMFMMLNHNMSFITILLEELMNRFSLIGGARLGTYIEDVDKAAIGLNHIKYFLSGIGLVYLSKFIRSDYERMEIFNLFLNIYVFGVILLFLFSFAPGAARIAQLFLFFEFLPFILLYDGIIKSKKFILTLFIIVLIITNILSLYSLAPPLWNYCS